MISNAEVNLMVDKLEEIHKTWKDNDYRLNPNYTKSVADVFLKSTLNDYEIGLKLVQFEGQVLKVNFVCYDEDGDEIKTYHIKIYPQAVYCENE